MCSGWPPNCFEYLWCDNDRFKEPVRVSAPVYSELLLRWTESQITDEKLFPNDVNDRFPPDFLSRIRTIFKRIFRVYAHIYFHHFEQMVFFFFQYEYKCEAHLNHCFKHFIYLALEFKLVSREELEPLQDLIDEILKRDSLEEVRRNSPKSEMV